jgi:tetratricopeptide (TPR) repeat protein
MNSQGSPSRRRLSVAMILRHEEDFLQATLESVRPIAEEVAVLDTGSGGQAAAVAERCGATVFHAAWEHDFSAARNQLLEKVTGQWVLWLEPGERLLEPSRTELREFVDRVADASRVYHVLVEAPPADPTASAEQAAQLRLMPSRPDLWFEGRVRETLKPSIEAAGLQIDMAPGKVFGLPRRQECGFKTRKAREDLELARLEWLQSERPQIRILLAMGEAASDLDDRAAARHAFSQAVRAAPRGSTEMLEAYYGLWASFEGDPRAAPRQLAICAEALDVFPRDAQLLCALGSYLQTQNRLDLAARAFDAAVRFGQVNPETWHLRDVGEVAAACLSLNLQLLQRDDDARATLEEALGRHPDSIRLRRHLMDLHVKHGRTPEALRVAERLPMAAEDREPLRNAVRGACMAARQEWLSALGYLQSAYVAGCGDPLCLRWLSVALLSNGQKAAALPVLHLWRQREPGNREVQAYLAAIEPKASAAPSRGTFSPMPLHQSQWHRIDAAAVVLAAPACPVPIVSQTFSTG